VVGPLVYRLRPFRNTDPPQLVQLWASQPPQRGLAQPINVGILEQYIFSKHYFDAAGLIVAEAEGRIVGMVHAGFGPNDEGTDLSTELGTIYMLMVRPEFRSSTLADQLLKSAEAYLRERGSKVLYGGGVDTQAAFYLGLYGGSELPGVLLSDVYFGEVLKRHSYRECGRVMVVQRDLVRFRAPVTRDLRRLRRNAEFETVYAPPTDTWWATSVYGHLDRIEFLLRQPRSGNVLARCSFWDIEPLASTWGLRAAGMDSLQVQTSERRQGYATYLLSEAFKELQKRGITLVEAQTMLTNTPAIELYKKLGFAPVDHGLILRREAAL
jgi:ribosomal protein S18 acetylase RimI-like enzyme